ncbi:ankyrin repeat domain-containing protein [Tenacibaculum finnmarkense genomovar ulcerans]|uniref:ankyrin repeat domain-containing protein n=1 Tax=Tenacibaculum finnmarkense TaxID=2781243 RepID=UPI001E6544E9|nr:ankyrin repeat domain-containing protein [Tenacibaculum finnmarkense]MCD8433549.1 ankyrin repeat domain-containing protein [Tenacibaculum finnmarkense genomovar ulcerans]MCG8750559.1 ankyrin repeat domain-containing protein [Tenacibaculum finnmarkense]MCG8755533.1 ankyrin repeat domain-containing protein [Tenacibaculum finnmarkense]MCG8784081.1 ankyrin repeat domain-containing protein [Tenacibaculum finnmarkense]MCG8796626.1 ankyrin repeat domain-containing protein [Tenacibaculum finnmarken
MKLFGPEDKLTELAELIMSEDIEGLEKELLSGLDLNSIFNITEYIDELPITLALCENKRKVINWLVSKKINLNDKENPAILMASANSDTETIKLLIEKGANVNAKHRIGKTAMNDALYGNNYEAISLLIDNGYDLKNDGVSFRQAVSNRQYEAIKLFLDYGVDVNFCKPDMVYPYNSTPVHIAAKNDDLDTVKLLVEKGADVTTKDNYGERPFNCAVANKNEEMISFIRSLEPEQWHNEEQRLNDLKSYKLPKELIQLLRSKNRKIECKESNQVDYLVFNSIINIKEVHWKKHKFLDLLSEVDNYGSEGFLVWYPKKKCFATADYEHEEFKELCNIKDFFKNPSKQIDKIFE